MVKINFDKLKTQVKDSFIEEFWNRPSLGEIIYSVAILLSGSLLWISGQSWLCFCSGVIILAIMFAILKKRTIIESKVQETPVFVLEKTQSNEYELFLRKASRSIPESDRLTFTIGDLLRSQDPQWLNHAISTVWRHLRRPSEDFVLRRIWPNLQKVLKSSTSFVKIELFRFVLGSIPPKVQKIEVHEVDTEGDKMIIDVDVSWSSEASVHLQLHTGGFCPLRAEIDEVFIKVKLRLAVNGIMKDPPMFKSVDINLREFPVIHWRAGGVATMIKDASIIYNMIMKQLEKHLRPFIMPRKLTFPLNCLSLPKRLDKIISKVDAKSFFGTVLPRPNGILNVQIKQGRDLIKSDRVSSLTNPRSFFKSPPTWFKNIVPTAQSSDPFVQVTVGSSRIESKVCFNTLNPNFNLDCDIPLECPPNNILYIRVFDFDRLKSNDHLGHRMENLSYLYKSTEADQFGSRASKIIDPKASQVELSWKSLVGVDHGEILMSHNWQPVKVVQGDDDLSEDVKGVISFAIQELCLESPGKPRVEVRVLKNKDSDNKPRMSNLDSWESMKPVKTSIHFKLGALADNTMDPFLLNGGMLTFDGSDEEIEIQIVTKSKEPFTYSTEKWSKTVTIEEVIQMSQSEEAPKIELDKKSSSSGEFCKATVRTLRTVVNRFTTCHQGDDQETTERTAPQTEQRGHAQTEISIKFMVYVA